jgi:6-pyruvoyltetrahydropterin/6-carboxytetrahydropterin synthase
VYTVTREIGIDAGHRVPFHESQCRNLHGHRYQILATAGAYNTVQYETESSSAGMLVDFSDLKRIMMKEVHDRFDHSLILWENDRIVSEYVNADEDTLIDILDLDYGFKVELVPVIPTAEELARYWFQLIKQGLKEVKGDKPTGLRLKEVEVFETPNNKASYSPHYS